MVKQRPLQSVCEGSQSSSSSSVAGFSSLRATGWLLVLLKTSSSRVPLDSLDRLLLAVTSEGKPVCRLFDSDKNSLPSEIQHLETEVCTSVTTSDHLGCKTLPGYQSAVCASDDSVVAFLDMSLKNLYGELLLDLQSFFWIFRAVKNLQAEVQLSTPSSCVHSAVFNWLVLLASC